MCVDVCVDECKEEDKLRVSVSTVDMSCVCKKRTSYSWCLRKRNCYACA